MTAETRLVVQVSTSRLERLPDRWRAVGEVTSYEGDEALEQLARFGAGQPLPEGVSKFLTCAWLSSRPVPSQNMIDIEFEKQLARDAYAAEMHTTVDRQMKKMFP